MRAAADTNPSTMGAAPHPAPVRVREFQPEMASAWDAAVCACKEGTPFHLTGWMRALQRTFDYIPRYLYATREGRITGVLPLFEVSNWIVGRCLLSSPFAVYGGVCSEDELSAQALVERAKELAGDRTADYLELRNERREEDKDFHRKTLYFAFTTELKNSPDLQLKLLPRDTRYMIRKAEKAQLLARSGFDQLGVFYDLFATSMRRLGTPVLPRSWFSNLLEEFHETSDLLVIYHQGRPVSGVYSLVFGGTIFPYYAGCTSQANRLAANTYMYWMLIKNGISHGLHKFDFGRSKQGTGAYQFKSAWNMQVQALPYSVYLLGRKDVPNFSPANPTFEAAGRLWSRLPLRVASWLGPQVVSWFP